MTKTGAYKTNVSDREALFVDLYQRVFPVVANHVAKMGGVLDEAKDVFHDALLVYYEKSLSQSLDLQHGEKAYIFGIARHLWIKRYNEYRRHAPLDQLMAEFDDDDAGMDWVDDTLQADTVSVNNRIMRVLQAAGQKCMELLTAFYYEKMDMPDVARRFGFSGPHSATVQKFKCLQKVKQVVKEKSLQYEDFVG